MCWGRYCTYYLLELAPIMRFHCFQSLKTAFSDMGVISDPERLAAFFLLLDTALVGVNDEEHAERQR